MPFLLANQQRQNVDCRNFKFVNNVCTFSASYGQYICLIMPFLLQMWCEYFLPRCEVPDVTSALEYCHCICVLRSSLYIVIVFSYNWTPARPMSTTIFIVREHAVHTERDIVLPIPSVRPSVQCRYKLTYRHTFLTFW